MVLHDTAMHMQTLPSLESTMSESEKTQINKSRETKDLALKRSIVKCKTTHLESCLTDVMYEFIINEPKLYSHAVMCTPSGHVSSHYERHSGLHDWHSVLDRA
eukprot:8492028-Ditylum_brightwellii.AAC.1